MNKIDEMIRELCPEGVKRVKLGEVGSFENIGVDKKVVEGEELVRLLNYVDVYHNKYIDIDTPNMIVSAPERKKKDCTVEKGDIFITPTSETRDDIGHASVVLETIPNTVYSYHIMRYRLYKQDMITSLYINIIFDSIDVKKQIMQKSQGLTRFGLSKDKFASIEIPLPPLAIQQEIVSILDSFSSLQSKLEEELAVRQKQMEFYREKLLTFDKDDNSVKWMTLPQISTNRDNQRKPITSTHRKKGVYPYYGASGIVDYVEGFIFDGDYLLISEDGANLVARTMPIAFAISGKNWVNNHAHVIEFNNYCTQRYVEMYFNRLDLTPWITGGAQPKLNQERLNKISIPLPPLSRQQEIVSTLDTMSSLIDKLKEEIELRKKQYEYYREALLSF